MTSFTSNCVYNPSILVYIYIYLPTRNVSLYAKNSPVIYLFESMLENSAVIEHFSHCLESKL